jgi:hypothetical protein
LEENLLSVCQTIDHPILISGQPGVTFPVVFNLMKRNMNAPFDSSDSIEEEIGRKFYLCVTGDM